MMCQALLLMLAVEATSVTELQSRHADSQRLLRMEVEHPGSQISRVELTADGKTRWETEQQEPTDIEDLIPADEEIEYRGHDRIEDRVEGFSHGSGMHYMYPQRTENAKTLPVLPVSDNALMAVEVQAGSATQADGPRQALVGHPAGPCLWLLEIGRAEKGNKPVVWRTVMVNGTKDDSFFFRGCTTYGEDAASCQAGVSIMRNMRGQVVEVGSCCNTSFMDSIVTSRIQHCGKPRPTVVVKAPELQANSSSSWWSSVYEAARESPLAWRMDTGSSRLVLEGGLFAVACLAVMLAYCLMYKRYKK